MSDVCGWASRRFLRFSRLSPVHAPRKLTAAAEHGDRILKPPYSFSFPPRRNGSVEFALQ